MILLLSIKFKVTKGEICTLRCSYSLTRRVLFFPHYFADPNVMKKLQVDRGAIKFVLAGANIMCPGLTSPGGALDDEVKEDTPVVRATAFSLFYGVVVHNWVICIHKSVVFIFFNFYFSWSIVWICNAFLGGYDWNVSYIFLIVFAVL